MPPRRPSSRSILPNFLRRLAVTVVKPLVSKRLWQRLRSVFAQPKNPSAQQQRGQLLRNMNLGQLAAEFGSDKWGVHYYTPHYERHLAHLKKERFSLLEIGIGGYARQRKGGASLRMWTFLARRSLAWTSRTSPSSIGTGFGPTVGAGPMRTCYAALP